jgi:hypothetical protein
MTEASFYYFFIELKSYGMFIDFKHAFLIDSLSLK